MNALEGEIRVSIQVRAIAMASNPTILVDVVAPSAYADEVKMLIEAGTACAESILAARRKPSDVSASPVTSATGSSRSKPNA